MKTLQSIAGAGEAAMGLALIVYPAIVVRLLFGAEIAGVGIVMSRFAGISLVGLGLACWAGSASVRVLNVMLIYKCAGDALPEPVGRSG